MSKLTISELHPVGFELLQDSESFLNELTDDELENVGGYRTFTIFWSSILKTIVSQSFSKITAQSVNSINGETLNGRTVSNVNSIAV